MNLRPHGNKVLVEPCPPPQRTVGGILFNTHWQPPSSEGVVVAVGRGRHNSKGVIIPIDLAPGDRVVYQWTQGEHAGRTIEWEGRQLKVMEPEQLTGVKT